MDRRSDTRKVEAQYTLENICSPGCPCKDKEHYTHLNLVRRDMSERYKNLNLETFPGGIDPPAHHLSERKHINVRGREEHEAVIKDAAWCKELGLDQAYEIMIYLKRWGGWLSK